MGCGASKTADSGNAEARPEHSRDKAPPKGRAPNRAASGGGGAPRQRDESTEKYKEGEDDDGEQQQQQRRQRAGGGGGGNINNNGGAAGTRDDPATLTVNMIADLRGKASKEGGSSVLRWIDCIVEPHESDNADIFDPMRRHALSMESVNAKLVGAPSK